MSSLQLDGNKLLHHLDKVNDWSRGKLINPVYLAFSPTSFCNHHCEFCVYHYKEFKPIFFPVDRYLTFVNELKRADVRSIFFAGDGDPLVHKDCHLMVEATRKAGIDIALNTNGRLINDKNIEILVRDLSFIRISLNAGRPETYAKIHGTSEKDFHAVIENLKKMVKLKKELNSNITIGVQSLLLSKNQDEIISISEELKEIGVDYFSVKPFLKHPEIEYDDVIHNLDSVLNKFIEHQKNISSENFSFYIRKALFEKAEDRKYKNCYSTPFMIEVDALGDMYTCGPYIGNPEHSMGNILKDTFENVWSSKKAHDVREYVSCRLDVSQCMPNCRPNAVNEVLAQIKKPPQHVNYI